MEQSCGIITDDDFFDQDLSELARVELNFQIWVIRREITIEKLKKEILRSIDIAYKEITVIEEKFTDLNVS